MKTYKVTLIQRNRIYAEVEAPSKDDAYWKVLDLIEDPKPTENYGIGMLGPSNVKIKIKEKA